MSYRLKDRSKTPHKGFIWIDPKTTMLIEARNYPNWLSAAIDHRVGMGLPIPDPAEMEDQLCGRYDEKTRQQYCNFVDGVEASPILGVGGTLKTMLAAIGISACWGCIDLARRMDDWGPDGCEENMPEIVKIMQQNADRRNWARFVPFKEQGSELLVHIAIVKVRDRS